MIGGRSLWGNLFDGLLSKYGWTFDYCLWGISYQNVSMLMADSISVYYDSIEEDSSLIINADDPSNEELIKKIFEE